jgi:hypothetical protein
MKWFREVFHRCQVLIINNGISASIALALAILYLIKEKAPSKIPEVKLNHFVYALTNNMIAEVFHHHHCRSFSMDFKYSSVVLMLRAGSKPMLHFYPKADCSRC